METMLEKTANLYLENCRTSGKSADTVSSYGRTLRNLCDFLKSQGASSPADVTAVMLLAWKGELSQRVSITSLDLYLRHAKLFFDFCADADIIVKSPYKSASMSVNRASLRAAQSKPYEKNLTESDFRKILTNAAPAGMHRSAYARNRAMLMLFLTSGMRNTSLRLLTPADLDWERGVIHVRVAKGGKTSDVLFADVAQQAVRAWLAQRPDFCTDDDTLFGFCRDGEQTWEPYSRQQISNMVCAAIKSFAGREGERSHALRHSMATMLQRRGMTQGEIGILLMHSDDSAPKVTSRYITADYTPVFRKANAIFNRIMGKLAAPA